MRDEKVEGFGLCSTLLEEGTKEVVCRLPLAGTHRDLDAQLVLTRISACDHHGTGAGPGPTNAFLDLPWLGSPASSLQTPTTNTHSAHSTIHHLQRSPNIPPPTRLQLSPMNLIAPSGPALAS